METLYGRSTALTIIDSIDRKNRYKQPPPDYKPSNSVNYGKSSSIYNPYYVKLQQSVPPPHASNTWMLYFDNNDNNNIMFAVNTKPSKYVVTDYKMELQKLLERDNPFSVAIYDKK